MSRLAGILLFSLLWAIPVAGQDKGIDVQLFRTINNQQNPSRYGLFEYVDHASLPTFGAVPLGFVVVGALVHDRTAADAGVLTAVSQVTTLALTAVMKEVVGRKRPFETLPDVRVKHQWSAGGKSLPSGHASQAFAIATLLSLRYSRASITVPVFLWASAIGYARIYLGLHYPSDVLAGALVGSATAFAVWGLRAKLAPLGESLANEPESSVLGHPPVLQIIGIKIPLLGW